MNKIMRTITSGVDVVREIMAFMMERKLYWLIPMVTILLLFGCLLVFASASGVGPFIYTLF